MQPTDPTLETVIRDAAFVFGYHRRNPDPQLRAFRFGRLAEARRILRTILRLRPDLRGLVREAVNAGLHYNPNPNA